MRQGFIQPDPKAADKWAVLVLIVYKLAVTSCLISVKTLAKAATSCNRKPDQTDLKSLYEKFACVSEGSLFNEICISFHLFCPFFLF